MEVIVLIGLQGSGKSTLYRKDYSETHIRINLDMLKTRNREKIILHACMAAQQSVVIDNANLTAEKRREYIELGKASGAKVKAVYLDVPVEVCLERNQQRGSKIPDRAIHAAKIMVEIPDRKEGFDCVIIKSLEELN